MAETIVTTEVEREVIQTTSEVTVVAPSTETAQVVQPTTERVEVTSVDAQTVEVVTQGPQGVAGIGALFSVENYGATGDGTTDDTANIQAAIDAAYLAGGGVVWVPTGTYAISAQVYVDEDVCLQGEGQGATTFLCTAAGAGINFNDVTETSGRRGGASGGFTVDMNTLAAVGISVSSVNRVYTDLQTENSAENSIALLLNGAQNNRFYGVELQCKSDATGPSGAVGLQLDYGASGNWIFGISTNQFTDTHLKYAATGAPTISSMKEPNNNLITGGMIERGPEGNKIVHIKAGVNNTFKHCNFSNNGFTPSVEYAIVTVGAGDTYSGSVTRNNHFEQCVAHGGLSGSTRYATAFKCETTSGDSTGRTVVRNCATVSCLYFFDVSQHHGVLSEGNQPEVGGTANTFYKQASSHRPNYDVESISTNAIEPKSWAKIISVSGTGNLETISTRNVPPGHMITLVFASARTIDTSAGNVRLNGDVDFIAASGDTLTLVTDGVDWFEPRYQP